MAGLSRRRRARSVLRYLLIAFFLCNFVVGLMFLRQMYGGGEKSTSEELSSNDVDVFHHTEIETPTAEAAFNKETNEDLDGKDSWEMNGAVDKLDNHNRENQGENVTVFRSVSTVSKSRSVPLSLGSSRKDSPTMDSAPPPRADELIVKVSGSNEVRLLRKFESLARAPTRYNWHLKSPNTDVIVAVQIHDRLSYLEYLFESFRRVPSWNNTVIVLSHDFYSPEIDRLVKNCTFAPIIDIYFPVPIQIFKTRFPGEDSRDCTRNMNQEQAKQQGCYNANYPDKYGHYREAKYSQTKHHWIWKLHYIFDEVVPQHLPSFSGPVLLLEEDHYVSPDFLHVLRLATKKAPSNVRIITLGNYKEMRFGDDAAQFAVNKWVSSRLNMGMSLTGQTWRLIKSCVKTFCDFDDYNWDWSLQFAAIQCIEGNLYTLYARSSRVFHVGECAGIHFKNKCIASEKVKSIKRMLSDNKKSLFPGVIEIPEGITPISQLRPKANGGWGDPRDRVICRSLASGSFVEILKAVDRAQTEPI